MRKFNMKNILLIILFAVTKIYPQTENKNIIIPTNIVSELGYNNIFRYQSIFEKGKNNNFLYLNGLKKDGVDIIILNNVLKNIDKIHIKDPLYLGLPKKITESNDKIQILYHTNKYTYITSIDKISNTIEQLKFKTKIKTKYVTKYIATENNFIIVYNHKKNINFWKFDFTNKSPSETTIINDGFYSQEPYSDLSKNILVFQKNKNYTTELVTINLNDLKSKSFIYRNPVKRSNYSSIETIVYDEKLIQIIKNLSSVKLRIYDYYLNNTEYKDYNISQSNVNYYAKKNVFSKKNVESFHDFLNKTEEPSNINVEIFKVNNNISLFINFSRLSTVTHMHSGGGFTTVNESSLGTIKTTINEGKLEPYTELSAQETLDNIMIRKFIMATYFELNNKMYLSYYDLNLKSQIINEVFK